MSKINRDVYNYIFWEDKGFFSWKGKTFVQVSSSIQKNAGLKSIQNKNISSIFQPNPLKLYRREIGSQTMQICNPRTSVKIDELNRPNGYLLYNTMTNKGMNNTLDIQSTTNKYDLSTPSCNTSTNCLSQQNNALKRVRSAGMNRTKYNSCTNSDSYNADTSQYLKSRHKSFQQNQFVYKNQVEPSFFKPNNKKFTNNGGVDASSLINRVRYDALTGVGATLPTQTGNKIMNSLAYAVPKEGYLQKGKPFPEALNKCVLKKCIQK